MSQLSSAEKAHHQYIKQMMLVIFALLSKDLKKEKLGIRSMMNNHKMKLLSFIESNVYNFHITTKYKYKVTRKPLALIDNPFKEQASTDFPLKYVKILKN